MKIVQSFWSKPSFKSTDLNNSDRGSGGWPHRKYFYMSWALSCLQFRQYYDNVELVTDVRGYDLLIDKLQLPYTATKIVLDDLNHYDQDLWAIGKIYTYNLQEEPFLHADCDTFIWRKLPEHLENAELVAQNFECGFNHYENILEQIMHEFHSIPEVLSHSKAKHNNVLAVNAGILGGKDLNFFKKYAAAAMSFINGNYDSLGKINIGLFNIIFEQFLFHAMAERNGIKIEYLLKNVNPTYEGLAQFIDAPTKLSFIHALSTFKKSPMICDSMEFWLHTKYPEYYYRIMQLFRTLQI